MDHYIDVQVVPDPEFTDTVLMSALFAKLHRALVACNSANIGVSFPRHSKTLGQLLRLHGSKQDLAQLDDIKWRQGFTDYSRSTAILSVPTSVKHRSVRRVQGKSVYNKRKRSVGKGWLTYEEAKKKIPEGQEKELKLPYAQIRSASTNSVMRVYVEHGPLVEEGILGGFSSYGLSATATVPWWKYPLFFSSLKI